MNPSTVIPYVSIVGAAWTAWLSYQAASTANRISGQKVDADAYERSRGMYERALADADRQIDRLRGEVTRLTAQLDTLTAQLAREKEVTGVMRDQVLALQAQVRTLQTLIDSAPRRRPPA